MDIDGIRALWEPPSRDENRATFPLVEPGLRERASIHREMDGS